LSIKVICCSIFFASISWDNLMAINTQINA
jgi:hypothetical protein